MILAALAGLTRSQRLPRVALWEPLGRLIVTWARSPGQARAVGHRERLEPGGALKVGLPGEGCPCTWGRGLVGAS